MDRRGAARRTRLDSPARYCGVPPQPPRPALDQPVAAGGFEPHAADPGRTPGLFAAQAEQFRELAEGPSDAYHLWLGDADVMVAYLLEITRKEERSR